jgi:hypothetical protein
MQYFIGSCASAVRNHGNTVAEGRSGPAAAGRIYSIKALKIVVLWKINSVTHKRTSLRILTLSIEFTQ